MSGKLVVVWICHFSTLEIQDILKPSKRINPYAPWISHTASLFSNIDAVELHIISPHEYISGVKQFCFKGINYHFFNAHIPFWGRHWPAIFKFDAWSGYFYNKFITRKIVKNINPDIINLHGCENAYYSSTIFQFNLKYPVLITPQGFLHKVSNKKSKRNIKRNVDCELKTYKIFDHYGYRTKSMGAFLKELNPHSKLHWHGYGMKVATIKTDIKPQKKYDLAFFAAVTKIKGIEDFLNAISLIKKQEENISSIIIGAVSSNYLAKLKDLCIKLDIVKSVTWAGFLTTQSDAHLAVSSAKINVLPVHYDLIPGTIIESMMLKVPVVAYDVGSIHEINAKGEVISLVKKGDVDALAEEIIKILQNEAIYLERADRANKRAIDMLNQSAIVDDLLAAYNEVIGDFRTNKLN